MYAFSRHSPIGSLSLTWLLRLHIRLAARHVDGKGNVRVDNLPAALFFAPYVSHAKDHIDRLVGFVGAGEMLNTFCDAELAISRDVQAEELNFGILGVVEEALKIATHRGRPVVLARGRDVIYHQVVAVVVAFHQLVDRGRGRTFMLELGDVSLRVGGKSLRAEAPCDQGCRCENSRQSSQVAHFPFSPS